MFLRWANPSAGFTSPRLRGEVEIRAQLEFRVRGTLRGSSCHRRRGDSPSPHPLPPVGGRGQYWDGVFIGGGGALSAGPAVTVGAETPPHPTLSPQAGRGSAWPVAP